MRKVIFICPFDINQLTGTPIRAKTVIECVSNFCDTSVISAGNAKFSQFSLKAIKQIRLLKPDIIHGFSTISIIPIMLYKLINPRTKIIFEMHGWSWFETKDQLGIWKRIIFLLLDIVGYIFANGVIVMSYTQKDYISKILYSKKNLNVIWGPVDFPILFEKLQARKYLLVGYQGNSSWWQGLGILMETAKILEGVPYIKFQLAGFDHSDKSKFPNTSNIIYKGKFQREDASKLIKNCDVMVSPRLAGKVSDLQYPQKLSEYLAAGRPVIGSSVSDQRVILEQSKAGFVLKDLSAQKLAEAIEKFSKLPKEEKTELGKNAIKFAERNFSPTVFNQKLKAVYNQLNQS